ncbi:MAG: hypothetical protein U1E73_03275 [Planctomycetota bacterium]
MNHRFRRWSEHVRTEAVRLRRARRQPLWPRIVGWGLMSMALLAAVGGEYPMATPTHSEVSTTAYPALVPITATPDHSPTEGVPAEIAWQGPLDPPFAFVLLDDGYRELLRVAGTSPRVRPAQHPELAAALGGGGVFFWFVATEGRAGPRRSELQTLEIR